ncbi:MAG: DUF92 domain-containing protein [Candidatus Marsarchaeota archaeon]|nr:DUF92 domain-containing protein [Candidatus Marsarchaeota archaeon]
MQFMTLDRNGVIIAMVMGAIMLVSGGAQGLYFLLLMVYFVVVSGIVTYIKRSRKKKMGLYQGTRGPKNVIANGLMPLILAVCVLLSDVFGLQSIVLVIMIGFVASVASVMADKFSSEIGVLDGTPVELFSFKKVEKGKSGAVTPLGMLAGFLGSFIVAATIFLAPSVNLFGSGSFSALSSNEMGMIATIIVFAGFIGTIVDSVFGYFEERGYGNKYTSNFICSVIGGVVGMALFVVMV